MSPEEQFLLNAVRNGHDGVALERKLGLLERPLDWEKVLHLTRRNGVEPRLYGTLENMASGTVPEPIYAELDEEYRRNAWHNLIRVGELLKILNAFQMQEIGAIAYKGPVMAAVFHGDPGLRRFQDLDVLVRSEDVSRARRQMTAIGYHEVVEDGALGIRKEAGYDLKFLHHPTNTLLELHWKFAPGSFLVDLDLDGLWHRAQVVQLAGQQVQTFAPDDLLFILCLHFANHCWRGTEQLKWVCDLDDLVRAEPLNWTEIIGRAEELGCRRIVFLGLALAAELLDTPVPGDVRRQIERERSIKWLTTEVRRQLLDPVPVRRTGIKRHLFYLHLREGWREKAQRSIRFLRHKTVRNLCK